MTVNWKLLQTHSSSVTHSKKRMLLISSVWWLNSTQSCHNSNCKTNSNLAESFYWSTDFYYSEEFIQATCDHIIAGESSIESIAYILNNFIDIDGGQCIDIDYDSIIEAERQTEWDSPAVEVGYRQWTYQLCSQVKTSNRSDWNEFSVTRYIHPTDWLVPHKWSRGSTIWWPIPSWTLSCRLSSRLRWLVSVNWSPCCV